MSLSGDIGPQKPFVRDLPRGRTLSSSNLLVGNRLSSSSSSSSDQVLGDDKMQPRSKSSYFTDMFSRKPPPASSKEQKQTLAQDMFKRRTVSSGNLFPVRGGLSNREFQRSNSQEQSKQSLFQIFSKKQERIEEDSPWFSMYVRTLYSYIPYFLFPLIFFFHSF